MTDTPPPPADMPPPSGPPPGWYPDPTTGQGFRWWDGFGWTERTAEDVDDISGDMQSVSDWMSDTFRTVAGRAGHLFPMIVLLVVPAGLFNGISVWLAFRDAVLISDPESGEASFTNPGGSAGAYTLVALSFVLMAIGLIWLVLAVTRQARADAAGNPEPWSTSMIGGLRRLPYGIGVALVVAGVLFVLYLVMVVTAVAAPVLLLLTFPAWVVGSVFVYTRLSLGSTGAALAPSGGQGLTASWELTRGRFWALFGRLLLLSLVGVTISLVAGIASAPFTALAGGGGTGLEAGATEFRFADIIGSNPAVFSISQLFSALGQGAATVVWAVGLASIYRGLGGPEDQLEAAEPETL